MYFFRASVTRYKIKRNYSQTGDSALIFAMKPNLPKALKS